MTVQEPTPAPLAICLFGSFSVVVNGAPLPRLRWHKQEAILALLTLRHERPVERDWLAALLWPEALESQGLATLRRYLTGLRHTLGPEAPRLRSLTSTTLSFDLVGAVIDVITFDEAVARGGIERNWRRRCRSTGERSWRGGARSGSSRNARVANRPFSGPWRGWRSTLSSGRIREQPSSICGR